MGPMEPIQSQTLTQTPPLMAQPAAWAQTKQIPPALQGKVWIRIQLAMVLPTAPGLAEQHRGKQPSKNSNKVKKESLTLSFFFMHSS